MPQNGRQMVRGLHRLPVVAPARGKTAGRRNTGNRGPVHTQGRSLQGWPASGAVYATVGLRCRPWLGHTARPARVHQGQPRNPGRLLSGTALTDWCGSQADNRFRRLHAWRHPEGHGRHRLGGHG
jgi:hypothetical protein